MATTHNRNTDRSHGREPVATDYDRLAYAGTWSPDWWSRLMAVGSMLVAAAALYYARYPDNVTPYDAASVGSGAAVTTAFRPEGLSDAEVAPAADEAAEETPEADPPQAKSKTEGAVAEMAAHKGPDAVASGSPKSDDISALDHALANAKNPSPKETKTLRANNGTELLDDPDASDTSALQAFVDVDDLSDDDGDSSSSIADSAPSLPSEMIKLDGNTELRNKLVVVTKDSQPLESEFAVTMTIRNTSDHLAVVSDVRFEPNAIIDNVNTELAQRRFGSSSPDEFVVSFAAENNQAKDAEDQGDYEKKLAKTYDIPANSEVDIRLAIENADHIGYGLVGRLTLEYNVTESLEVENTAIAFIVDQDE